MSKHLGIREHAHELMSSQTANAVAYQNCVFPNKHKYLVGNGCCDVDESSALYVAHTRHRKWLHICATEKWEVCKWVFKQERLDGTCQISWVAMVAKGKACILICLLVFA